MIRLEQAQAKDLEAIISIQRASFKAIYDKYLDHPLSHKAHELLHTRYFVKRKK